MKAKEIMTCGVSIVRADSSVADVLDLMEALHVHGLPVVSDSNELIGIVERNTIGPSEINRNPKAFQVMNENPLVCYEDDELDQLASLFQKSPVRHIVVQNSSDLIVGIISMDDFARTDTPPEVVTYLRQLFNAEPA